MKKNLVCQVCLAELDGYNRVYWRYFPLCRKCDREITNQNGQVFVHETNKETMNKVLAGNFFMTFPKPKKGISPGSMIVMTEPETAGRWHSLRYLVVEVVNVVIAEMAELPGYCMIEVVVADIENKKIFSLNRLNK